MVNKKTYAAAFVITVFIFTAGVIVGNELSSKRMEEIQIELDLNALQMRSLELEKPFFDEMGNEPFCEYINIRLTHIGKDIVKLGEMLTNEESNEKELDLAKRQYSASIVNYWLFVKMEKERCSTKRAVIAFFYEIGAENSRQQGRVLDYLVYKSNGTLTVLALDKNLDESVIELLKKIYNVTSAPAVVIDNKTYMGFQSRENITDIICKNYNNTICQGHLASISREQ